MISELGYFGTFSNPAPSQNTRCRRVKSWEMVYTGVKVFSATKARERGSWRKHLPLVAQQSVVARRRQGGHSELGPRVPLSDDHALYVKEPKAT